MGNAVNVEYQKGGLIISSYPRRAIVLIELLTFTESTLFTLKYL